MAALPTDPLGLSLEVKPGAILLGGDSYPNPAATVQLLSVNRENATVTPSKSFTRDRRGMEQLSSAIEDLSKGQLAVVAASPAQPAVASDAVDSLNAAIARIGARPLAKSLLAGDAGFSVVGVRGSDAGSAYVNPDVPAPDGDGSIFGYLQPYESETGADLLAYVPSEYHTFDTGGDNGGGQATITIGTDRYVGSLPSGQAGFLVITLEGGVAVSRTLRTNGAGADETDQATLAAQLAGFAGDPNQLVLMQSIGKPRPTTAFWEGIGQAVARMKGDPTAVNTLDGNTDYAFVGGSGVDQPAQATSASGLPGRLSGVLGRSRSFHLQPLLSDSSGVPDYSLLPIVFQQPQQWPTPGGPAVLKYISNELTKNDDKPTDDIRAEYLGSVHDFLTDLSGVNCSGVPNVDESDCNQLKTQLAKEFAWVDKVHDFTGGIQQAIVVATGTESNDLLPTAKNTVEKSLAPPADAKAVGEVLDFVADIVNLIASVPAPPAAPTSPVPEEEEEEDGPMGGIAAAFQLIGDAAGDLPGDPLLGEIEAEAEKLDQALGKNLYQLHAQLDTIDHILVEDYGKLQAVGSAADVGEPFNWDDDVDKTATAQLTQAALQWFYGSLLPIGYDLAQLTPGERNAPGTGTDTYTCRFEQNNQFVNIKWFEGTPAAAQFPYVTALNPNGSPKTPTVWTLAKSRDGGVHNGALAPSSGLANALFGPPEANGLGLHAAFFLPRYLKPVAYGC